MKAWNAMVGTVAVVLLGGVLAGEVWAQGPMPFSQTYRRPSVSPYTMLGAGSQGFNGGGVDPVTGNLGAVNPLIYQQLIQPRVEQEQQFITQMQQGRQINQLGNRVREIQQGTTAKQVNEQIRATGHVATYQNLSHFYPGAR